MTAEEYYALVSTYDERMIEAQIAAIPPRINPTGRLYKKLVKEIYENATRRRN